MARKKIKDLVVKMVSQAGTGFFYTTRRNPKNIQGKLLLRKYDPVLRQHAVFKEEKISRRKK